MNSIVARNVKTLTRETKQLSTLTRTYLILSRPSCITNVTVPPQPVMFDEEALCEEQSVHDEPDTGEEAADDVGAADKEGDNYKNLWVRGGDIFLREDDGNNVIQVAFQADIDIS